jgi:hypothetical protein
MAWQAATALRPVPGRNPVSSPDRTHDRGLLARLDTLVELAADRHGLALLPDGRLAAAEARMAARAAGIGQPRGPTARAPGVTQRDAVELLRAVAEGVGLLRARGDRLEATSLRHAWAQIDEGLRAGLVYAAWCYRVPWPAVIRAGPSRGPGRRPPMGAGSAARPARRVQVGLSSRVKSAGHGSSRPCQLPDAGTRQHPGRRLDHAGPLAKATRGDCRQ